MKPIINILLAPARLTILILFLPIAIIMLFSGYENKAFNIMDDIQELWMLY